MATQALLTYLLTAGSGPGGPSSGDCLFGAGGWTSYDTVPEATWEDGFFDAEGAEVTATIDTAATHSSGVRFLFTAPEGNNDIRFVNGDTLRLRISGTAYEIDTSTVSWQDGSSMVIRWEFGVSMSINVDGGAFEDSVSLSGSGDWTGLSVDLQVGGNGGSNLWNWGSISCPRKL